MFDLDIKGTTVHANINSDEFLPVGCFPTGTSPYGVYNLIGNVQEWGADWYSSDYYAHSSKNNPTGPEKGEFRVIHGTFGKGIATHFMIPYNRKQWAIELELMNYSWVSERVPMPEIEEVLDGALKPPQKKFGPNSQFWYPKQGGIEALPRGFLPYVKNIELNSEVTKISVDKKEIEINGSDRVKYDKLISTLPLFLIINLLDKSPQEIAETSVNLEYNTIYAVNLGIDRENLLDFHWVYYPEDDYIFHRISFPMNFAKSNAPEGKSSITAEISCSKYKPVRYDSLIEYTIRDLNKAEVLREDDGIIVKNVRTLCPAFVIYDLNHRKNVDLIYNFLEENDIYPCGRFGEWEYLNMDTSILSGRNVVKSLER